MSICHERKNMSDIKRYIEKRIETGAEFADEFEVGYANFKIGVRLRQAWEAAGMTQEKVTQQLNTTKSAISRIESHAVSLPNFHNHPLLSPFIQSLSITRLQQQTAISHGCPQITRP